VTLFSSQHKQTEDGGPFVVPNSGKGIYEDGSYFQINPSWHIEESPFKVRQILRMMERQLAPKTICDIG
jgi:hypothetical protein